MANDFNGGINQDFLDELKFKCDVVSIISQYVPLTKKGNKYFGNCPFHNEKTGTFCVNTSGQFYYCFGCHASGNVISFIMEMESLSFIEAVKFLAEKAGMELPEFKIDPNAKKKKEHKEVLHSITRDAALYYRKNLLKEVEGKEAREYLESRGITEEIAKHYGMGLSLKDSGLYGYLRRKEYSDADIRECGLVAGQGHDPFDNRIMVPIIDGMGNVVAFGGRIYHGETGVGKYVNSTNTNLFDKSHFLYGANFIKKEKRENSAFKEVILVEGYMDVISLGSAGIKNAVAGMGTALNAGQARELARLADTVLVCYDGDGAGRKASAKNLDTLMETGIDIKVVSLPDGKDPDEVIRGEGVDAFRGYLKAALPVIEYRLKLCEEAYDLNSYDGRQKYIRAALAALENVKDAAEKRVYLEKVAALSRVSADALIKEYGKVVKA
ncbi:MAG: DNA primase, partial [Clostridia bacterium]|nr:DNA primase [Clostridia bacterium]